MMKEDLIISINNLESSLERLKVLIQKSGVKLVNRREIQESTQKVSRNWFEDVEPVIANFGITSDISQKYHTLFTNLISLSTKISLASTYLVTIETILKSFRSELLVSILKSPEKKVTMEYASKILENVTSEEKEYLNEALGCSANKFFRASIVLGWSATIHRMQKTIEKMGFTEFNKKTDEMKKIKEGRFKRFQKSYKVNSLSELRATVFDNDLLWVLEYSGFIDVNQHDRLSMCFTMRNNSAHPGEAPITEENLISFYSDLKNIVFDNPKFKI